MQTVHRQPTLEEIRKVFPVSRTKLRNTFCGMIGKKHLSVIMSDNMEPPVKSDWNEEDTEHLLTLIPFLEPREQAVIRMRFGFHPYRPHFLREIADKLGLTRERVRQIARDALLKLREGME